MGSGLSNEILFTAVIPKGSRGGDTITVTANGATGLVRVPNGLSAGQMFRFKFSEMTVTQAAPTQPSHFPSNFQQIAPINPNSASQFTAQVPPGVLPGQPFEVNVNGLRVQLICPPNSYPGMQFVAQIPNQQPSGPLNQPPPQNMYAPQQQLYSPQQNPSNQPAFSAQPVQLNPSVQQHSPQPQQPQQPQFNQPNQPLHVLTQPFNPHFVAQNNIPVAVAEMVHDEPKHYGKV